MRLAEITNAKLASNLQSYLDSIDPGASNGYWIGLSYVGSAYAWNSGTALTYKNWDSGAPR